MIPMFDADRIARAAARLGVPTKKLVARLFRRFQVIDVIVDNNHFRLWDIDETPTPPRITQEELREGLSRLRRVH
jgi:hypothetical protein